MKGFPPLSEDDFLEFDQLLGNYLSRSHADLAMIVEKAGYLIHRIGRPLPCDDGKFASLSAAAFIATQELAECLRETRFSSLRQRGDRSNTLTLQVDDSCLLVVVFQTAVSADLVEAEALPTLIGIHATIDAARQRAPGMEIDFADLNPKDITSLFQRKRD